MSNLSDFMPGMGLRNRIMNGKMDIAQRGASFPAIAAGTYTLDRWVTSYISSAVTTLTQQADVPSSNEFQRSFRIAVTTADASIAAGDIYYTRQYIEGYNVRDLIGKTFTLSFWVRSSKTGTHCVAFKNSGADRSFISEYTISTANTWEYKTVTVSGGLITAGTWNWTNGIGLEVSWLLACGLTFQTTANAWQTGSFFATSNQVNCLDTIGNVFAITGVQLEPGGVATPFEQRPYGLELALCQRYYQLLRWDMRVYTSIAGGTYGYGQTLPVPMRATPSLVTYSGGTFANVTITSESATNIGAYMEVSGPTIANTQIVNRVMSYIGEL